MSTVTTRGTVVIDVDACKGCDLCIDACPPKVLVMTTHEVNERGYRYPQLLSGLHGLQGLLADLPRLRVPGLQVRPTDRSGDLMPTARAARGLRGDRRRDDRRRLPVLRRLPDDAVHRGPRAHGPQAARGRRRVHERRERARGRRHGVGGGGHGNTRGHRFDRSGPVAHAGVARGDHAGPASRSWSSTWPAPRATTTRPRAAEATATTGTSCSRRPTSPRPSSSRSAPSTSRPRGATPCSLFGDYYLAHTAQSVSVEPLELRRRLPAADWALDGTSGGSGTPSSSRRWVRPSSATTSATTSPTTTWRAPRHTAAMLEAVAPLAEIAVALDDAEVVVVAFGSPAQLRAGRRRVSCGPRGGPSATCARSRSFPFPSDGWPPRPTALGPSPCTRTTRAR